MFLKLKGTLYVVTSLACLLLVSIWLWKPSTPPEKVVVSPAGVAELSPEEYIGFASYFVDLADRTDPRTALTELRERTVTDERLLRSCHPLVHELGRAAYARYSDFAEAMQYRDEICNSGYLHGVIEAHFSASEDIFTALEDVCAPYPLGKYLSWECYHGVGHGLMYYSGNDLPRSLELCDAYEDAFARMSCRNGVFMENFNVDGTFHTSEYITVEKPIDSCRDQRWRHKGGCYLYLPSYYLALHKNAYADALSWCRGAEFLFRGACAEGVGTQAMKENLMRPEVVEAICAEGKSSQTDSCITGMVGLYINHYGALQPAEALCERLSTKNSRTCKKVIVSYEELF